MKLSPESVLVLNRPGVFIPLNEPIPLAYTSLYEDGDIWVRIQGCEACANYKRCCGDCPMITDAGCFFHLEGKNKKPLHCIITPIPTQAKSYCALEFECIKGSNKGKVRRVRDKNGVLNGR